MKARLLFVANVDWFFISHRLPIALEAIRRGYEVHIATAMTNQRGQLEAAGLIVHELDMDRGSDGLFSAAGALLQIRRVFARVKPDLAHLVTIKPVLLGGLAARWAHVPAVVSAVSGLGYLFTARGIAARARQWMAALMYRLALGCRNQQVIFQNRDDRALLMGIARLAPDKARLIRGSGVDLKIFANLPLPQGLPIVVMAARMLSDKGVREFEQAARQLRQRDIQARFCLVGAVDPPNPASLSESELRQWAEQGNVEVWGHRSDMPNVLRAAQFVVLPSYREGMPKILLEAAACGRAVITTDVPGCRDAIEPGVTGLLVPARDAAALARAMEQLLVDRQGCAAMGIEGRRLAERAFDIGQVVAEHMRIYEELLAKA